VQLSGAAAPTRLGSGEYTVVKSGVGAPYVTTVIAYPATATVTISRWVPLTQPLDLPSVGSFSPDALERALELMENPEVDDVIEGEAVEEQE
jgi:hypothetical protein